MSNSFLLDTHAFFWLLRTPDRIPKRTISALEDPANKIYVSAVVAFEIATKVRLGKFPQAQPLDQAFDARVSDIGASSLPLTVDHALAAGRFDWDHRDPFDRLLAAQAIVENLRLVTSDAAFQNLPGLRVAWQ